MKTRKHLRKSFSNTVIIVTPGDGNRVCSFAISRTTDTLGCSTGFSLGDAYAMEYGYDAYGRFSQLRAFVSSCEANAFSYSYLPGTPLVSGMFASSGHAWTRSYELHRNLITAVTNSFNGNLISAFDYANDAIGRRTARLDTLPETIPTPNVFEYNLRSEVIGAAMGTNTYGYVFDPIGNRIVSTNNTDVLTYTANALNQYTAISNAVVALPVHDDDGNMLTNGVWSYTWDGENRLVGVSSNDVKLVSYAYDHQSRRIGKTVHHPLPATHSYIYDGWNLVAETSGTNTSRYVWGLDLSGSLQGAGGVGGLLAVVKDSTTYHPAFDGNGNVCEYTDASGTIAAHYEYSPFGETVIQAGDMADAFAFRFSTKYWESEAKLYYYGYRFYAPHIGRWLNRDPIGEQGGINVLAFIHNHPLERYDRLGLHGNPVCGPNGPVGSGWGPYWPNPWEPYKPSVQEEQLRIDERKLIRLLTELCPSSSVRTSWNTICCPADCSDEAKRIAQAIISRVRSEAKKIVVGGWFGNFVASVTFQHYGYGCIKWQKIVMEAYMDAINSKPAKCFFAAGVAKFWPLVEATRHNWVEIIGPEAPIIPYPDESTGIVVDPWPSGGTTVFPVAPYTPDVIIQYPAFY
jgi:RHS repeat-associated protein